MQRSGIIADPLHRSRANVHPLLIPKDYFGNSLEIETGSKNVDYTINLLPHSPKNANAVDQLLRRQSEDWRTVNQIDYAQVSDKPCAVSIVAKATGGLWEAGIWTTAHFERPRMLCHRRHDGSTASDPALTMISHPVIIINSSRTWELYIAVDKGKEIVIPQVMLLGDTGTWASMYKLLKSLRAIARWSDGTMREWFSKLVMDAA